MSGTNNTPPASAAREVLRARARALAQPPQSARAAQASIEVLEFSLGQERYAVESRLVREAYPLKTLTPLPCAPAFIAGIVNVRGRITAVIDMKKFFDLPGQGLTDLHRVILVRRHDFDLGLLADAIVGVRDIALNSLQSSLATLTGVRGEYVKGVTAERLVVLDLEQVLADPRIVVDEEVPD